MRWLRRSRLLHGLDRASAHDGPARLSREHPRLHGLALPGMPPGAPGMRESAGSRAAFSTLPIARDGHARTYRCMPKHPERGLIPVKCAPAMF
ncbi:MAG: hypothetical protein GJU74_06750 [Metallibacterium scheffleri]|nr:hypothetical protein [Metallibacterium scheffleri]